MPTFPMWNYKIVLCKHWTTNVFPMLRIHFSIEFSSEFSFFFCDFTFCLFYISRQSYKFSHIFLKLNISHFKYESFQWWSRITFKIWRRKRKNKRWGADRKQKAWRSIAKFEQYTRASFVRGRYMYNCICLNLFSKTKSTRCYIQSLVVFSMSIPKNCIYWLLDTLGVI